MVTFVSDGTVYVAQYKPHWNAEENERVRLWGDARAGGEYIWGPNQTTWIPNKVGISPFDLDSLRKFPAKLLPKVLVPKDSLIISGVIGQRPSWRADGDHRSTLENIWGASFMSFAECCPDERNRILVSPLHRQTSLAPRMWYKSKRGKDLHVACLHICPPASAEAYIIEIAILCRNIFYHKDDLQTGQFPSVRSAWTLLVYCITRQECTFGILPDLALKQNQLIFIVHSSYSKLLLPNEAWKFHLRLLLRFPFASIHM